MKKQILLILGMTIVANFGGKYAYDFCVLNHIDLVRPMFVGLFVTCVVALSTMKTVLPAALGVGSAIGDVIFQIITMMQTSSK